MKNFGMNRREVLAMPYGEYRDMLDCLAIDGGGSRQKKKAKAWTYEEVMSLR